MEGLYIGLKPAKIVDDRLERLELILHHTLFTLKWTILSIESTHWQLEFGVYGF